jgi:ribosomal protein L11 methyltransferase
LNESIYREIALTLGRDDALNVVRLIDDQGLADLCGYFETLYDAEGSGGPMEDRTRLMLYFPSEIADAGLRIDILMAALNIEDYISEEREIGERDYLEAYKKHYRSFPISPRIVIVPSWEKTDLHEREILDSGKFPLYLDPGLAFGTGLHPTTALCLEYLDERIAPGMRLIDAGCGSGILGMGALLLGANEVFAFDIDGNARIAVRHNLAMNPGIADRLIFLQGGFDLPEFAEYGANLLVANLTANIILNNLHAICEGHYQEIVLSGILADRESDVIEAMPAGWRLHRKAERDGWALLIFERAG